MMENLTAVKENGDYINGRSVKSGKEGEKVCPSPCKFYEGGHVIG